MLRYKRWYAFDCPGKLLNYTDRVQFFSSLNKVPNAKFSLIYSLFFVFNHITKHSDLLSALQFMKTNLSRQALVYIDFYRNNRLSFDPPKDYRRVSGDLIKTAKVSVKSEIYEIRYRIEDKKIRMRCFRPYKSKVMMRK